MKKAQVPTSPSLPVSESSDHPPISPKMEAFLKTFRANPGRWFYHLEPHAKDIEEQLVARGFVERGEHESKGRLMVRYCGVRSPDDPPVLDMNA